MRRCRLNVRRRAKAGAGNLCKQQWVLSRSSAALNTGRCYLSVRVGFWGRELQNLKVKSINHALKLKDHALVYRRKAPYAIRVERCCVHVHTHSERVGCHSCRYLVTVQGWIVTTAEAIWHLLYGESDAVLGQHTETLAQAAWTTCFMTLCHLFWMLGFKVMLMSLFLSFIKIHPYYFFSFIVNTDANMYII